LLHPIVIEKNETEKRLVILGGGSIEVWSLDNPDAGRGRAYATLCVDEAAQIGDLKRIWEETLRSQLMFYRGSSWFASTPRGLNFFHELYQRGQNPEYEDFKSWCLPSWANPHIDPEEIEKQRRELSEMSFRQEVCAQFINREGQVFRRIDEALLPEAPPSRYLGPSVSWDGQVFHLIGCD